MVNKQKRLQGRGEIIMEKKVITWRGKEYYLLGKDSEGINYYLKEASWDCDWHWGFGYVETFINNNSPKNSKDIRNHQHFDMMFLNTNGYDAFKKFFKETTVNNNELWKLVELMKSFYVTRNYSDFIHRGSAGYSSNPAEDSIKNEEEYNRINKTVIPNIISEVYKILGN